MKEKEQALQAIETVANRLAAPEPLSELERIQMSATLEFARRKVGDIQELQKRRPVKKDTAGQQ